jgi:hypothetical protein
MYKRAKGSRRKRGGGNRLEDAPLEMVEVRAEDEPNFYRLDLPVEPNPGPGPHVFFDIDIDVFSKVLIVSSSVRNRTIIDAFSNGELTTDNNAVRKIVRHGALKYVTLNTSTEDEYYIEMLSELQPYESVFPVAQMIKEPNRNNVTMWRVTFPERLMFGRMVPFQTPSDRRLLIPPHLDTDPETSFYFRLHASI